jgi:hypothetical protein
LSISIFPPSRNRNVSVPWKRGDAKIPGVLDIQDPNHDDFELWSPSEGRDETCLFGRQTLYHRRIREKNCYVGEVVEQPKSIVRNCTCTASDFEWYVESRPEKVSVAHTVSEFNYYRDKSGRCVLVEGAAALTLDTSEEQCDGYTTSWYERTAYRKIPYSSCEGGERPDRGKQHSCPGLIGGGGLGGLFWGSVAILPFACAGVAGWWWFTKGGRPGWVGLVLP